MISVYSVGAFLVKGMVGGCGNNINSYSVNDSSGVFKVSS